MKNWKKAMLAFTAGAMVAGGVAYKKNQDKKEEARQDLIENHERELRAFDRRLEADSASVAQDTVAYKLIKTIFREANGDAAQHNDALLKKLAQGIDRHKLKLFVLSQGVDGQEREDDVDVLDVPFKLSDVEYMICYNALGASGADDLWYNVGGEFGSLRIGQKDGKKDVLHKLYHAVSVYKKQEKYYPIDYNSTYDYYKGGYNHYYSYDMREFVKPNGVCVAVVDQLIKHKWQSDQERTYISVQWPEGCNLGFDVNNPYVAKHLKELVTLNDEIILFERLKAEQRQKMVARQAQELQKLK